MAPTRKKASCVTRRRKMEAFLQDFDREVARRLKRIVTDGERMVQEVEHMYDMAILRLPPEIREMNWLQFFALARSENTPEDVAKVDREITKIRRLSTEGIDPLLDVAEKDNTFFVVSKIKRSVEADEEAEPTSLPLQKRSRLASQCPSEAEIGDTRTAKVKTSTKKPPTARRPPSATVKGMSKRSAVSTHHSLLSRCFRVFKTPGLRTPAINERVYTFSAKGSPLAEPEDVILTVPLGGGESIRLTEKDLTKKNFLQLNPKAQGLMKKLSVSLGVFVSHSCKAVLSLCHQSGGC
ncbi:Borealin [Lonchura striata]|uniref:Borealin n=1 Tax=Lonchura striata TaxID=40157 RepID=A0A218UYP4_9PASE|nr:Borealin [Lonchura striata domestica]